MPSPQSGSLCLLAAGLMFLAQPFLQAQAQPQFLVAAQYDAAGLAYTLAAADFNKDGKLDVVTVNSSTNALSVLLGNGDGTFQPAVEYPVGWNPYAVVMGDFNGDGNLDLAVSAFGVSASVCSNQCQSVVSILLGNGDGTFQPRIDFYTGGLTPGSMAVGDFNGDGKLDLVISNGQVPSEAVSILLGNGDGTFQPALNYSIGGSPGSVVVADFNGDGKADLAVVGQYINGDPGGFLSVSLGNGDGTFQAPITYATAPLPGAVAVADVNGDGKPDLVVTVGDGVSVLLGNGDGTFQPHLDSATGGSPGGLFVADFNGDGKPDVALLMGGQAVVILPGNGDGTFQPATGYIAGADFFGPFGIVAGDFDGDQKPDLAVAGSTLSVFLNEGAGGFQAARSFATGNSPDSVVIADLNGDGRPDLAVANSGDNTVSVLIGNGDGSFQAHVDYPTGMQPVSVAVGDFSGDGKLDLAVANWQSNTVSLLLGNGDGTFRARVDYATGMNPVSIAVGDFNGDGKPDLAIAFNGDSFNQSTTPGGVDIFINRGDGTFLRAVAYSSGGIPAAVAIGDFNRDGHLDLAIANGGQACHILIDGTVVCRPGATLGMLLGNGDGTFQAPQTSVTELGPSSIVVADFNGDGNQDVALANPAQCGTTISMLWGNGDGTFRPRLDYQAGSGPLSLAAGDLNGDSKPDLAVAASAGNAASVLLDTANGPSYILSAEITTGAGAVSGLPQILCTGECAATYLPSTSVTLVPEPAPGNSFSAWTGDCSGTSTCVVNMNMDRSAGATFSQNATSFTLTLVVSGNGIAGTAADQTNLQCTGTCQYTLASGATLNLGASPYPGSSFAGWSGGGCTARMIDCSVTMTSNLTLTAAFTPISGTNALTVTTTGNGTVLSNPTGIDCGSSVSSCSATFSTSSSVNLTASPGTGYGLSGWSGACSGTGACMVTMSANESVTATFSPIDFSLSPAATSLSLQSGAQGNDVITISPQNGSFMNAIQLSCAVTGPPPMPTCALSPSSVTPNANPINSTLTIAASSQSASLVRSNHGRLASGSYPASIPLTGLTLMGLCLVWIRPDKRRHQFWMASSVFVIAAALSGCGAGSSGQQLQSRSYTVAVTATSGALTHTTQVTVTVQ